jgi:hypothetical protein
MNRNQGGAERFIRKNMAAFIRQFTNSERVDEQGKAFVEDWLEEAEPEEIEDAANMLRDGLNKEVAR